MNKDQIFVATTSSYFPRKAFEYAVKVAEGFEKEICFISLDENPAISAYASGHQDQTPVKLNYLEGNRETSFHATLEEEEASMIIFELTNVKPFNDISRLLKISRELRIPYIFVKDNFNEIKFDKIIVPITFLPEEKEKGRFASGFGRFLKSDILIMKANDFGSKAQTNTNAIKILLDKFNLSHNEINGKKDSYKVEMEAIQTASQHHADMAIVTASREYGLDDIIFGPKELKIIKKSTIPVMLLNPRGDLYVLCN